ncbi:glycosyltransferase [Paracoccus laeviglucosivorans]|uniref:Glycosyl transferases group 1 n=1 Tax=Paracoccus laeviglucosivorans TaxID=1197861 RepID=A0A521DAR9_9RHOB|nr:glycosyltransferase [Paracoccus laeviglucosivorans]SMO68807.1 Glycosyl transferases group 1 [Paracoccus laeviglucosivorans]
MSAQHPELTLFAAVPASKTADGRLLLDDKFVSGMTRHAEDWAGPVRAVLRDMGEGALPFASAIDPAGLNFQVTLVGPDQPLESALGTAPGVILASADMIDQLGLGQAARGRGLSVVYGIEYTLETRLRIVRIERGRSLPKKLWSMLWNIRQERHRRAALKAADGIQMNGFPAEHDYAAMNAAPLRYLDNRMSGVIMATEAEMEARRQRHAERRPLRLIHSGRLEPMKGGHLLVPLARALRDARVPFSLDIYGTGSLEDEIRLGISQAELGDRVQLHQPVPFETGLVPVSRSNADIFVSCHVQSDPSCTYLEAMGCGLPVVGFANRMLAALVRDSHGGWCVPMDDIAAMAALIGTLDRDRATVMARADDALAYARAHDFEAEFDARMRHLAQVVSRAGVPAAAATQPQHGLAGS